MREEGARIVSRRARDAYRDDNVRARSVSEGMGVPSLTLRARTVSRAGSAERIPYSLACIDAERTFAIFSLHSSRCATVVSSVSAALAIRAMSMRLPTSRRW